EGGGVVLVAGVVLVGFGLPGAMVPASGVFWPLCCCRISACSCFCAAASAAAMFFVWLASHVFHSGNRSPRTRATMSAWLRPHSSAHWPLNTWWSCFSGTWNHVWFV